MNGQHDKYFYGFDLDAALAYRVRIGDRKAVKDCMKEWKVPADAEENPSSPMWVTWPDGDNRMILGLRE